MKCPTCDTKTKTRFVYAEDLSIEGLVCVSCWTVFDMVDNNDDAEHGKGKKIGHKKNKYVKMGKNIQTWHIRKKDKKEPKKVKGG